MKITRGLLVSQAVVSLLFAFTVYAKDHQGGKRHQNPVQNPVQNPTQNPSRNVSQNGPRMFTFTNHCKQTIWVGALNSTPKDTLPAEGGWELKPGQSQSISIPFDWSGRFWGRTDCQSKGKGFGNCSTGDCGGRDKCGGIGGRPPATLAEFTLSGAGGKDFYDLSLVDGYNVPMKVAPKPGSYSLGPSGNKYECGIAQCANDINKSCPAELQLKDEHGRVVGCASACERFNTDQYCCRGAYGTPDKCPATAYSQVFKKACPDAYSYAYDDTTSTYTCQGPGYDISFC